MAVELPKEFPFSVDTWSKTSKKKHYHFLSHAHSDHTGGLEAHASHPIYCTEITRKLVLQRFPQLDPSLFETLELDSPKCLRYEGTETFTVTAYDANHCAGAMMLLFEGSWGAMLHTGDCRLSPDCLSQLDRKWRSGGRAHALAALYLDCTFALNLQPFPSKLQAVDQVLAVIRRHPDHRQRIYLAADALGGELLLRRVCETLAWKLHVDGEAMPDELRTLQVTLPSLLTDDPAATRLHLCEGFPRLYERAREKYREADKCSRPRPVFIRPSTQWYTCKERGGGAGSGLLLPPPGSGAKPLPSAAAAAALPRSRAARGGRVATAAAAAHVQVDRAVQDEDDIWHVCFSMHSSRLELQEALEAMAPRAVVPTTRIDDLAQLAALLPASKPKMRVKGPGLCCEATQSVVAGGDVFGACDDSCRAATTAGAKAEADAAKRVGPGAGLTAGARISAVLASAPPSTGGGRGESWAVRPCPAVPVHTESAAVLCLRQEDGDGDRCHQVGISGVDITSECAASLASPERSEEGWFLDLRPPLPPSPPVRFLDITSIPAGVPILSLEASVVSLGEPAVPGGSASVPSDAEMAAGGTSIPPKDQSVVRGGGSASPQDEAMVPGARPPHPAGPNSSPEWTPQGTGGRMEQDAVTLQSRDTAGEDESQCDGASWQGTHIAADCQIARAASCRDAAAPPVTAKREFGKSLTNASESPHCRSQDLQNLLLPDTCRMRVVCAALRQESGGEFDENQRGLSESQASERASEEDASPRLKKLKSQSDSQLSSQGSDSSLSALYRSRHVALPSRIDVSLVDLLYLYD
eukprot:jgi/Mesen1/3734/ME000204S02998